MSKRPQAGKGLFYHRDSEGHSDLVPPQYVQWARTKAESLGVTLFGKPEDITKMIDSGNSAYHDLYLDYGVSGNIEKRAGFEAFKKRALEDHTISHLFIPRRDRVLRPDDPIDGVVIESTLRKAGLTIVYDNTILPPYKKGEQINVNEIILSAMGFSESGRFRRELASKMIYAKIKLAELGFAIGGKPPYGFERYLANSEGVLDRVLRKGEQVRRAGYHVIWLPTHKDEMKVIRRIFSLYRTTSATKIAQLLTKEGILSPDAGRISSVKKLGKKIKASGVWWPNTIKNIVTHPVYIGLMTYGKRLQGDQLRFSKNGPRALEVEDFNEKGKAKVITTSQDERIVTHIPGKHESVITQKDHEEFCELTVYRAKHLKGRARAQKNNPNPLGVRVYDMNCGWPMYRHERRKKWNYHCGLYLSTESKCCNYNTVNGQLLTNFVVAAIRQKMMSPEIYNKIKKKITELAYTQSENNKNGLDKSSLQFELDRFNKQTEVAKRNFAFAENDEERSGCREAIKKLLQDKGKIQAQLDSLASANQSADPETEVQAALGLLDRLVNLASEDKPNNAFASELIKAVDAKVYLQFDTRRVKNRTKTTVTGGILTLGNVPPPIPLYEGPTGKMVVLKNLADGLPVSPILVNKNAPKSSKSEGDLTWSRNVQRVTTSVYLHIAVDDDAREGKLFAFVGNGLELAYCV